MNRQHPSELRPLTEPERRLLRARIAHWRRRRTSAFVANGPAVLLVCGVLWALTMLASDAPWPVITLFWLGASGVFLVWSGTDAWRLARRNVTHLEAALRTDRARDAAVEAEAVVELEEQGDEGACYAFQLAGDRILFISGQEFYPSAKFPNSDFSLVEILDAFDRPIEFLIDKRGRRLAPVRAISAADRATLRVPAHRELIDGRLEHLETLLAR